MPCSPSLLHTFPPCLNSACSCIDIDCRFAAIDALGNFFKSLNNTSAALPTASPASSKPSITSSNTSSISRNTLGGTSQRILAPSPPLSLPSSSSLLSVEEEIAGGKGKGAGGSHAQGTVPSNVHARATPSVDDTLLECLHVVLSNLHACAEQHCAEGGPGGEGGGGGGGGGGIQDRMFISVLRTLIALYAYLHTLNLNLLSQSLSLSTPQQQQQNKPPESSLLYHQQCIEKSRKQAQEYVPEVLSAMQLVLHKAYQLLKVKNKFSSRNQAKQRAVAGEEKAEEQQKEQQKDKEGKATPASLVVSVAAIGSGDHDSTVRLLHHSLQLIATVFLFERPGSYAL